MLLLPVALVAKQPDLGTSLLVAAGGLYVIFFAGLSWRLIVPLVLAAALGLVAIVVSGDALCQPEVDWQVLRDYQKQRVCTLLDPTRDPLGKGFHILQGMIAIGSGGLTGKGFMSGTQTHLEFIPERTTDFIFAAFSEEFGLAGVAALALGFSVLILRGLWIAAVGAHRVLAPAGRCAEPELLHLCLCQHGHGQRHPAGGGRAAAVHQLRRHRDGDAGHRAGHADVDRAQPRADAAVTALCPTPVAVVGIGNMGLGMALRLRDAGQAVRVHDTNPARQALALAAGAVPADSAAAAAAGCALLIVAVVDAAQTDAVLFGQGGQPGAAATLAPGAAVLLCPTIGPQDVARLASRLAAVGLACLDAPMSGGPARARDGSMSLMVAGDTATWQTWQPLLRHLAARLFYISDRPGDGARTKLVNNLLAATNLAAAAEAIALAQRLGLDGAQTLAVIGESSGHSWIGADRMARALAGDFAPRAHTTLLAKDAALALGMAALAGVQPLLGRLASAQFQAALVAGFGAEDDARLLSLLQSQQMQQLQQTQQATLDQRDSSGGAAAAAPG